MRFGWSYTKVLNGFFALSAALLGLSGPNVRTGLGLKVSALFWSPVFGQTRQRSFGTSSALLTSGRPRYYPSAMRARSVSG